jgi:hypothetical protein
MVADTSSHVNLLISLSKRRSLLGATVHIDLQDSGAPYARLPACGRLSAGRVTGHEPSGLSLLAQPGQLGVGGLAD